MGQISHLMGLRRDEIHLLPFHFYPLEGKLKNGGGGVIHKLYMYYRTKNQKKSK